MAGSQLTHQHCKDIGMLVLAIFLIIIRSLITTPSISSYNCVIIV